MTPTDHRNLMLTALVAVLLLSVPTCIGVRELQGRWPGPDNAAVDLWQTHIAGRAPGESCVAAPASCPELCGWTAGITPLAAGKRGRDCLTCSDGSALCLEYAFQVE